MQISNTQLLAKDINSMVYSGDTGGNPVISKAGLDSISQFMCFQSEMNRENPFAQHDFGDFDIRKVPLDLLKEKIKLELTGNDEDVINHYLEKQRQEYELRVA